MSNPYYSASDEAEILRTILRNENEGLRAECADLQNEIERLRGALDKPLRETILAVLRTMPTEAAPEHLAAAIESQVRAWQAIPQRP